MKKRVFQYFKIGVSGLLAVLMLTSCSLLDSLLGKDTEETGENNVAQSESFSIFADGKYQCKLIAPGLADVEATEQRNVLRQAFKSKTGVTPAFEKDDAVGADDASPEILFGQTNRAQSGYPEGVDRDTDAYWMVAIEGNKLVINGSDAYQLSLAVNYFIESYLTGDVVERIEVSENPNKLEISEDFTRPYWQIQNIPAYPAGKNQLSTGVYNGGTTILNMTAGGRNDTSAEVHVIQRTDAEEFSAYCALMERYGYVAEYENTIEQSLYLGYYNGEHRVYVSFNGKTGTARVCLDPEGMSVSEFGYSYTPKAGETSVFYQYAIPMADGTGNGHPNCGMLLVVKCADNSVIIVDGGDGEQQMNDAALAGLNDFLHEITGAGENDTIRIAAWYVTHYHGDHIHGFLRFLRAYKQSYSLERIIANIPTLDAVNGYGTSWENKLISDWQSFVKNNYPSCKELKVHAGQELQIADVKLQVLYTHEDLLNAKSEFNSTDSNDTSTVIRMDNGKISFMVLGDANTRTQSVITAAFGEDTLKSDIMQAPHHLIYHLETINYRVLPSIAFIPQSEETSNSIYVESGTTYKYKLDKLIAIVGEENCYFGGSETVGIASIDGVLTKVYHRDGVVGKNSAQG